MPFLETVSRVRAWAMGVHRRTASMAVALRTRAIASVPALRWAAAGLLCCALAVQGGSGFPSLPAVALAGDADPMASPAADAEPERFGGSTEPGRGGVEASAVALVAHLGGLAVDQPAWRDWLTDPGATDTETCPPRRLRVRWAPPEGDYQVGAYVAPLGPPPTAATTEVNGVVVCDGSYAAYLGFQASWDGERWLLDAVPALAEHVDEPLPGEDEAAGATPAHPGTPGLLPPVAEWAGTPIEPLPDYEPQTTCDPTAKPGALGFRDLILAAYPDTYSLGIGRVCEAPGVSEHKEGRAWDWGVDAHDPEDAVRVQEVLDWLLGPDEAGNPYAIARRIGLMYVIWDGKIWSAVHADAGWRPYEGVSSHTDHVHFSFTRASAAGFTSFWTGDRAQLLRATSPDLPLAPVPSRGAPARLPAAPALPPPTVPSAPAPAPVQPAPSSPPTTTRQTASTSGGGGSEPPPPPPSTTTTTTTTTTTAPPPTTPEITVPGGVGSSLGT